MAVGRIAAAVDDLALFRQRGLLGQVVRAVQFGDVLGDGYAFGVHPRPFANAVASVHRSGALRR